MSVNVAIGDILQVRMEYGEVDQQDVAFNILYYQVSNITNMDTGLPPAVAVPAQDVLPGVADDFFTLFAQGWRNAASASCAAKACTVQNIWPGDRSIPFTYIPAAQVVGARGAQAIPLQDAPTLLKKSQFGQRWGQGRLYYYGLAEDMQVNGILEDAAIPLLDSLAQLLKSQFVATVPPYQITMQPRLVSFDKVNNQVVVDRVTPIVTARLSDRLIKTQRRRRQGKGI